MYKKWDLLRVWTADNAQNGHFIDNEKITKEFFDCWVENKLISPKTRDCNHIQISLYKLIQFQVYVLSLKMSSTANNEKIWQY